MDCLPSLLTQTTIDLEFSPTPTPPPHRDAPTFLFKKKKKSTSDIDKLVKVDGFLGKLVCVRSERACVIVYF